MRNISLIAALITIIFLALTGCQSESSESLDGGELNKSTNEKQDKEDINVISDNDEDSQEEDEEEESDSSQDEEDQTSSNEDSDNNEHTTEDQSNDDQSNNNESNDEQANNDQSNNESQNENNQGDDSDVTVVSNPSAIDVVVNKRRKLPDGYTPPNLTEPNVRFSFDEQNMKRNMRPVAANALEELFAGANKAGVDLFAVSGYRSYDRQVAVFNSHVESKGREEAEKVSAIPGHSEHQTGLAMDVTSQAVGFYLTTDFESTTEGQWVAENAHKYGFIIRYPKGKSEITGYSFEPWHLRYIGKDLATKIHESGLTVEEYLGLVE
ncbi:hypothetical protein CEY16_00410 [Halalkalibacillus sediminis]|uniref:D-alanyl-D-alanine carboxypeptidase-like core domain-containing protein n=1 Tax=Halalkalibacillus sediminis TaxID=2018042 RepID=A0A2I0QVA0_9BACI|nr:M15 family metallopeptidase [Halalkalibacillus sediminis]PKR78255.1 hypothetical protein CEY16_00410 [Halalkalibacillus sediminis]